MVEPNLNGKLIIVTVILGSNKVSLELMAPVDAKKNRGIHLRQYVEFEFSLYQS